ncbi:hypothetical protein NIES4073_13960 [Kalymmatonema gypsitolerans NIES-4073]|nr:hypothetical protein NIES4073_13960 [Scytonema sp. NIES-4073]
MSKFTKHHPVILFPGIAGSRLKTRKEGKQDAHPLWFNSIVLAGMSESSSNDASAQEVDDFTFPASSIVESDKTEADLQGIGVTPSKTWQEHMKLQADGITPKKEANGGEKFNREVEGLEGIKNVSYPLLGLKPDEKSDYYQALVDKLKANGYQENVDLIGHPYDWRVAPGGLERRYQTFTNLKTKIEELYTNSQLPIVLIAHSMGNRVVQYFLKWIETNASEGWVDKYIERYIAISPPWIGAPQAIYRLSDSPIVLPTGKSQVALKGMKDVLQSFSSIPWLLPLQDQYFNTESFGYYKDGEFYEQDLSRYRAITMQETLVKVDAQNTTLKYQTDFYQNDPLITDQTAKKIGSELIKCPAVNKLDVIYSTGFETPVGAYYEYKGLEENKVLTIATNLGGKNAVPYPHRDDLTIKKGIILETPATKQQIEVEVADRAKLQNSGDSVVPYGSLTYFKKWQKEEPNRHIVGHEFSAQPTSDGVQYPSVNHNAIVAHPDVITKIIKLLSESNA